MAADTMILKNTHSTNLLIVNDLGLELAVDQEMDLLVNYDDEQLLGSTDLETIIGTAGDWTLKLNNTTTFTYVNLIDYLKKISFYYQLDYSYISGKDANTDVTSSELERLTDGSDVSTTTVLHTHDNSYYTKTELSDDNQGTVSVNWANITNMPPEVGGLHWKNPVDRTNSAYGSGSMLPTSNNEINDARMVTDDGDGKAAQYVCIATSGAWNVQWQKMADIDWGTASYINVVPAGNISSTNIQSALEELQTDIDNIINGTTDITLSLDDAYNHGSTITVDDTNVLWKLTNTKNFQITESNGSTNIFNVTAASGADSVAINAASTTIDGAGFSIDATATSNVSVTGGNLTLSTITSGTLAVQSAGALNLKDEFLTSAIPLSQTGTAALDTHFTATSIIGAINELKAADTGEGSLSVVNGNLYIVDTTRSNKKLSVSNFEYAFADNSSRGKYVPVGTVNNSNTGYRMPLDATIVGMAVQGSSATGKQLQIRKLGTTVKSFTLTTGTYISTNDSIDLIAGDVLQVFSPADNDLTDVVVSVFVRWRTT